ncbi:hypothetical protein BD779DRAFT_1476486 [Infundibulicybe gibba]|nr:hypothetical protein BD779DRAFT_1476486 [Infundibulicybe gibba]
MTIEAQAAMPLGIIFEGIFYGAYMALFILYLVLWRRNNRRVNGLLTLAQILLFGFCTLSLCIDISADYYLLATPDPATAQRINLGSTVMFTGIDCLAQMILVVKLYRCWIVWGRRWMVVAVPGFLALAALALHSRRGIRPYWSSRFFPPEHQQRKVSLCLRLIGITTYSISLGTTALTTSLIVAKILSTSREVRPPLGSNSHRSFRIATAMLIESGLLMVAFQLLFIVLFNRAPGFDIISYPTTQIYLRGFLSEWQVGEILIMDVQGIAPTLLNIRVVMGSEYGETTEKTLSLRFAHSGGTAARSTRPSMSVAGVQSQGINTELDVQATEELPRMPFNPNQEMIVASPAHLVAPFLPILRGSGSLTSQNGFSYIYHSWPSV